MQKTDQDNQTTDFGYKEVPVVEKAPKVAEVFHSVAEKYDLMNDVMSFGLHRIWKRFTLANSHVKAGDKVLDLAGGTGDLTASFSKKVGEDGLVILGDINSSMLKVGKGRLLDRGIFQNVKFMQMNAECLPFSENYFDCISIAFGLRNVTDKQKALNSMYSVLKPGGQGLI